MAISRIIFTVFVMGAMFPASAEWHVDTVDDYGFTGINPAISLDGAGVPWIAYGRDGYGAKYAFFNGTYWENGYIYQSSSLNFGWFDMVMDENYIANVSFGGDGGITYALQIPDSKGWSVQFLPVGGKWTSISLDSQGNPCIALLDFSSDNRFLFWNGTGWVDELIEAGSDNWGSVALVVDESDVAHVAYNSSASSVNLKYALRDASGQWTTSMVDSSMSSEPRGISMVLDNDNAPIISYNVEGELRCASWNGASWNVESVYSMDTGAWEYGTSIALDTWDCPHIAHCSPDDGSLLYSVDHGTGWETVTVPGAIAGDPDIALDAANRPHIAFHSDAALMYAFNDETGIAEPDHNPIEGIPLATTANPFSGSVGIRFELFGAAAVDLTVYDLDGRQVEVLASGVLSHGEHSYNWVPGPGVPVGQYIIFLKTPQTDSVQRTVFLR